MNEDVFGGGQHSVDLKFHILYRAEGRAGLSFFKETVREKQCPDLGQLKRKTGRIDKYEQEERTEMRSGKENNTGENFDDKRKKYKCSRMCFIY
jgi:hypothetical protein